MKNENELESNEEHVFLNARQSQLVDQIAINDFGMSGLELMETAGGRCTNWMLELGIEAAVILSGTGNNGGDGMVIARHLQMYGIPVQLLICGVPEKMTKDTRANFARLELPSLWLSSADEFEPAISRIEFPSTKKTWVVDALLGTGAKGDPRPPMDILIHWANKLKNVTRLAIDVPSGLDVDSGVPNHPTFRADFTLTFVTLKTGFQSSEAASRLGQVELIDIGIPQGVVDRAQHL